MLFLLFCLPSALALSPRLVNTQKMWQERLATAQMEREFPSSHNKTGIIFAVAQQSACGTPDSLVTSGRILLGDQKGSGEAQPANPFGDASFPDAIFVETLKIGTPPRNVKLQMDTGSWQL